MKTTTTLFLFVIAVAFYANDVHGQIIYTDIDPDTTISAPTGNVKQYSLDLNNDGIIDFYFKHFCLLPGDDFVEAYSSAGQEGEMLVDNDNFPFALNALFEISSNCSFWHCSASGSTSSALYLNKHWWGATDKYLGVRIKINTQWHYGWVRMSVYNDATGFCIKDYAYESLPETTINAGQNVAGINQNIKNRTKIFVINNTIVVNTFEDIKDQKIIIQDIQGRRLKTVKILQNEEIIDISSFCSGVYLVSIIDKSGSVTKKILKQ